MGRPRTIVALLFAAVTLAGCYAANDPPQLADAALSSYAAAPRATRESDGPYMLGPGDRIRLKVYDDDNLSGEYEVSSNGFVSVPLVGQIRASGLSTRELEHALAHRMRGKIARDPKVNVEVAAYAPFYIYGEVKKAGVYPYQPGLTVADAIATAGGLTYRADEDTIYLQHPNVAVQQKVRLDVPTRIAPGDNIRVDERMF